MKGTIPRLSHLCGCAFVAWKVHTCAIATVSTRPEHEWSDQEVKGNLEVQGSVAFFFRLVLCFKHVMEVSGNEALSFSLRVFSVHHLMRTTPFLWSLPKSCLM